MVDDRRQDDEFEAPYSEYEDDLDRDDLDRPRRRLNPTALVLGIAVLAALAFLGYSTATRDVPLMTSAAVVLGLVLIVVALTGAVSTVRAGSEGRAGRAFLLAILGGLAGMLAFGCLAVAALLVLVYRLA